MTMRGSGIRDTERDEMELKPCPFCGEAAFVWPAMIRPGYRVSCQKDCVSMPARPDTNFTSEEAAVDAWNTRSAESPKPMCGED